MCLLVLLIQQCKTLQATQLKLLKRLSISLTNAAVDRHPYMTREFYKKIIYTNSDTMQHHYL